MKGRKYAVPDGSCTRIRHGGKLKEVPKPWVRWYDTHKAKRPVEVTVMGFWGIGRHYYVTLKEDWNGIWNGKEECWQECWDDDKARGRQFDSKFDNMVLAAEWVRKIQQKHFPKKTHKLSQDWNNLHEKADKKVWYGMFKEGD